MDAKLINPFIEAFSTVLPQIGFQNINKGNVEVKEKSTNSRGVTVLVGVTKGVRGNVVYNMTEEVGCFIASTMMCGMPVASFDEMAQSAIGELANMVTANAATNLAAMGYDADISTPCLTVGNGFSVKLTGRQYVSVEMYLGAHFVEVNVALE